MLLRNSAYSFVSLVLLSFTIQACSDKEGKASPQRPPPPHCSSPENAEATIKDVERDLSLPPIRGHLSRRLSLVLGGLNGEEKNKAEAAS